MKRPKMTWPTAPTVWVQNRIRYISVPFTWNLPRVQLACAQMGFDYNLTVIGGPAVRLMPSFLLRVPGVIEPTTDDLDGVLQRINPLATRTSVGCVNACGFCGVPKIEPAFRELRSWLDRPVLCDNNLLACTVEHFDKVMDLLERHGWCDFNQGLDCRLLNDHHADRIGRIKGAIVRLALDNVRCIEQWEEAFVLLRRFKTAKSRIRSYVLCGFHGNPEDAWHRCKFVEERGAMPLPQWYHSLDAMKENEVTKEQRQWGWTDEKRKDIMRHFYRHTDGNGSHG